MQQGSVLGPTLFLIFVNDINTVISSHIQKFADDCKVYRSVPTAQDVDILQQDINNLCQWSKVLCVKAVTEPDSVESTEITDRALAESTEYNGKLRFSVTGI